MQSGIRNTLTTQAQTRTQDILGQQQSNKDWWFQVQQQQMAQRRAMPALASGGGAPAAGFESARSAAAQPEVATDIIKWPSVLRDPQFAQERARVEAPYRRAPKGEAIPTVDDYKNMIDAAEQMKTILGQMTAEISAQAYLNTVKFLDQLAAEARGRIETGKAAPEQPAK
jgi:crotonobetainyl-CoA:carnitine CoA-transferase CaiB-like acyl-CoA transferase